MAADGTIRIDVDLNSNGADRELDNLNKRSRDLDDSGPNRLSGALRTIGTVAVSAVAGLAAIGAGAIALAKPLVEAAGSAAALNSQFSQVFGGLEGQARNALEGISKETNILSNRLQGSFTTIAAFARTTGVDQAAALDLATRATRAAADSAAFYDRSIESTTESLQSFLKGNYENDSALGISATETTRNAVANQLYGQSFKDLDEAQKQLALLTLVEQGNQLSGALGQAAREGTGLENVTGNLRQSFTDLQARLGEQILEPAIGGIVRLTEVIQAIDVQAFVERLQEGFNNILDSSQGLIDGVIAAFQFFQTEILPIVINVVTAIYDFVVDIFTQIYDFYQQNGAQILQAIMNVWGFIYDVFKFFLPAIEVLVKFVWDSIQMVISGALDVILGAVRFFAALFTGDFSGLWDAIVQIFTGAIDLIIGLMNLSFVGGLRALAVNFVRTFLGFFRGLWDDIVRLFSNATTTITNTISAWVSSVLGFITNLVRNGRQFISDFVSSGIQYFKNFATDVIGAVSGLPGRFLEIGKNVIKGFIDGVKSLNPVKLVGDVFNNVKDTVKGIFDINSPSRWARDEIVGNIAAGFEVGTVRYRAEFEQSGSDIAQLVQGDIGANLNYNLGQGLGVNQAQSSIDNSTVNNITVQTDDAAIELERQMRRLQFGF